jgi:acetate kinase
MNDPTTRVLVVNAGSSSLKLALLEGDDVVDSASVERWAGAGEVEPIRNFVGRCPGLVAVGHRVVHGGPRHTEAVVVDEEVLGDLESITDLAPLHQPRALAGIREVARLLPSVPQVAAFDTAFHSTMSAAAYTYALPREWNHRWQLRRYGFHGLSHAWAVRRASEILGRRPDSLRIVSCHLGAGASLTAVRGGKSVDTTMGFTPLAGLVMATRSGSVDPGLLTWLLAHGDLEPVTLTAALEHQSGLRGLTGTSGDVREVLAGRGRGDPDCVLAFDVYVHTLVREIGAMTASLDGIDVLVFTGGVGEHSAEVRAAATRRLGHLGVVVDPDANDAAEGDADITAASTPGVATLVVSSREDAEVARLTREVLSAGTSG